MTQEEAKELWPIVKAYSEGKTIEYLTARDKWVELKDPWFNYNANMYRIKLEPTYRPFKNADECFEEMKKHKPFGWIKNDVGVYRLICGVRRDAILFSPEPIVSLDFRNAFNNYVFADGAPFGIKED